MILLICKLLLRLMGWKVGGIVPVPKEFREKCVVIAAPHTSNWDMPLAISIMKILDIKMRFTIKKEWMFFPMNILMKHLGAIPIDRSKNKNDPNHKSTTQIMIDLFKENDHLTLIIPAEGTRKKTDVWHTSFYHVAVGANVPILIGFMDYKNKCGGVLGVLYPSGDMEKDMREIMGYFRHDMAKYPDNFALDKRYS
jgi:1-acyl-sn-glycerol-3-phosphate acyltransferase